MSGKYPGEGSLSDDEEGSIDISELPNEYRIKLNGFLRNACHDGHETLIRILLDKGADVNYITPTAELPTVLHVAVSNTKDKILPILLSQASDETIESALQFALQSQTKLVDIVRILKKEDSSVSSTTTTTSQTTPGEPTDSPQKETITQTTTSLPTETPTDTPPKQETPPPPANPDDAPKKDDDGFHEKIAFQERQLKQLEEQAKEQEEQIRKLREQLAGMEAEKMNVTNNFEEYKKKIEVTLEENRAQIEKLEKESDLKGRKIEKLTKERDKERKAKEVAKRILSSNGPSETETIPLSSAIRLGLAESPSPSPSPIPNGSLDDSGEITEGGEKTDKSTPEIVVSPSEEGTTSLSAGLSPQSNTPASPDTRGSSSKGGISKDPSPRVRRNTGETRAKDDMDIASEAERARVRRLVKRWEEMKFI